MEVIIKNLAKKKLVGMHLKMSFVNNRTGELWKNFMQRPHEISNKLSADFFSIQCYPLTYFKDFKPTMEFEKWATVEVSDFTSIPKGMGAFELEAGLYAVFYYKGSSLDTSIYEYIFGVWIQKSGYALDDRPHFEVLGEKYKNEDPNSEEEIWIPIKNI